MGEIKDDNVALLAAGVAFYFWVALIPAIIGAVMIYGLVADPQQITSQIESLLSSLSSEAQSVISDPIESAAASGGLIGTIISLAGVLWSASGGMNGLIKGVGVAYDEPDERNFVVKRGLAILLTLGGIVALALSVLLIAVIPGLLGNLGLGSAAQTAVNVLRWPLLAVVIMASLAIVYKVGPDRDDPKMRWASWGAVVATILWLIGSGLFSLYVSNFGSYNATYGALAGVIILNLWLFLTAFIVLFGAELNSEMEAQTRKDTTRGEPVPMGEREAVKADNVAEGS
jgi:membrane protein